MRGRLLSKQNSDESLKLGTTLQPKNFIKQNSFDSMIIENSNQNNKKSLWGALKKPQRSSSEVPILEDEDSIELTDESMKLSTTLQPRGFLLQDSSDNIKIENSSQNDKKSLWALKKSQNLEVSILEEDDSLQKGFSELNKQINSSSVQSSPTTPLIDDQNKRSESLISENSNKSMSLANLTCSLQKLNNLRRNQTVKNKEKEHLETLKQALEESVVCAFVLKENAIFFETMGFVNAKGGATF